MTLDEATGHFSTVLQTLDVFPENMPEDKQQAMITELTTIYKKHIMPYYTGITEIMRDCMKNQK